MTEPSGRLFSLVMLGAFVVGFLAVFVPIVIRELR